MLTSQADIYSCNCWYNIVIFYISVFINIFSEVKCYNRKNVPFLTAIRLLHLDTKYWWKRGIWPNKKAILLSYMHIYSSHTFITLKTPISFRHVLSLQELHRTKNGISLSYLGRYLPINIDRLDSVQNRLRDLVSDALASSPLQCNIASI